MYVPAPFRNTDRETAFGLIEDIRLGTLVSVADGINASHLPFMVERNAGSMGRLVSHCARANRQWESLDGREVLVTFLGPHTYVSPGWYGTHPRAPTWLYAAVHVRGRTTVTNDADAVRDMVVKLSHEMDPPDSGWAPENVSDYIDRLLPAIVGFHIEITDIQTQLRLAQQNGHDDRSRVHRILKQGSLSQRLVCELMERFTLDRS